MGEPKEWGERMGGVWAWPFHALPWTALDPLLLRNKQETATETCGPEISNATKAHLRPPPAIKGH